MTLLEMFERMEAFFRRRDTYIKVKPNKGLLKTIYKIMAQVVNILAIATKEIEQSRTSAFSL
jgi:hypothetical protein